MSGRVWGFVGVFVVVALAASFAIGRVRDAARSTEEAARAVESAAQAVTSLDSITLPDADSLRTRAQAIGGAIGAGLRAIIDTARAPTPEQQGPQP